MPRAEPESVATSTKAAACSLRGGGMPPRFRGIIAEETGARFGLDECPRCRLGRTQPVPPDLAVHYDSACYGQRHGLAARFCRRWRLGLVRRWAGRGVGKTPPDYGRAEGDFLLAARSRGWKGVGIERTRQNNAAGDPPVVASLAALDPRDRFACATFWHVLEHLDDPGATLDQLRNHLQPDGVVLALDLPRHPAHFTPRSLAATCAAARYVVAGITSGEFEYDLIGWSQSLLNRARGGRNEFFKAVSGRPRQRSTPRRLVQVGFGLGLTALAVGPTLVERWAGPAGIPIVAARARR